MGSRDDIKRVRGKGEMGSRDNVERVRGKGGREVGTILRG